MKKFIVLFVFIVVGVAVMAQNSVRTEGRSLITVIPSSTAASTGNAVLPVIPGGADWSVQIIPVAGGTLTSDSVYATVQTFVSNSLGAYSVWTEPKTKIAAIVATGADATVDGYFALRDTIANTTVALTPGVLLEGKSFQNSRIKIVVNRPASLDSVNYYVYYVYKYPQTNPQR